VNIQHEISDNAVFSEDCKEVLGGRRWCRQCIDLVKRVRKVSPHQTRNTCGTGKNNAAMWCVVSVYGRLDVNVALNRPSYQTSTLIYYYARNANDGNKWTYMLQAPHCAHTNSTTNPWWAVDLGVALHVLGVKFTNRGDCCSTYVFSPTMAQSALLSFHLRC